MITSLFELSLHYCFEIVLTELLSSKKKYYFAQRLVIFHTIILALFARYPNVMCCGYLLAISRQRWSSLQIKLINLAKLIEFFFKTLEIIFFFNFNKQKHLSQRQRQINSLRNPLENQLFSVLLFLQISFGDLCKTKINATNRMKVIRKTIYINKNWSDAPDSERIFRRFIAWWIN